MSERTFRERVVDSTGQPWSRGFKYIKLKSGRMLTFWDARQDAEKAHTDLGRALSRAFKLADDDWDLERLEWFLDHLYEHMGSVRQEIERRRGVKTTEERIAALRITTGRTPEEIVLFTAKADELEARLKEAS